jgi:competence transcription factor ComK
MEITLDSTAFIETKTLLRSVFPKEAALCLYGNVRQVVGEKSDTSLIATITKVSPAVIDSANEFHVWFPILSGCENDLALIAAAHSHTTLGFPCTHSFADAMVLFNDKRLLFTLVFCADGFTEALYQDGRRALARWAP